MLTLALLAAATAARANDIPRLAGPVTDLTAARVLAPAGGRIPTRIDQLLRNDDIQLFVLFVDTTGSYTVTGFADETARLNSLGGNDVLLVVALTDRTDALWRSDYYLDRLTDAELQGVLTQQVEPHLRAGDDIGAVISCADGLAAAGRKPADVTIGPAPTAAPLPAIDGTAAALVLVGVGGSLLWGVIIARRREGDAAVALARKDAQRSQEANALLIRAGSAIHEGATGAPVRCGPAPRGVQLARARTAVL